MFEDDQSESVIFRVSVDGKMIFETRKPEEAVALIKERSDKGLAAALSRHHATGLQGGPMTPPRSPEPVPAAPPRLLATPASPTPIQRAPAKPEPVTALEAALRKAEVTRKPAPAIKLEPRTVAEQPKPNQLIKPAPIDAPAPAAGQKKKGRPPSPFVDLVQRGGKWVPR